MMWKRSSVVYTLKLEVVFFCAGSEHEMKNVDSQQAKKNLNMELGIGKLNLTRL